jgi:predicted RNA-binding protein YlxR (DUF448 family)
VRDADGIVSVDARGRRGGRGAYVCAEPECVERALKPGRLTHAFRAPCRVGEGLRATVLDADGSTTAVVRDSAS